MELRKIFRMIPIVLVSIAVGILYLFHFDQRTRYVYVDAQQLVNGYSGMQEAKKRFEAKTLAWKSNLDTLQRELEAKVTEYEQTSSRMTPREKQLITELLKSKEEQYLNYQQVVSDMMKKENEELSGSVLTKVNDFLKRYGKEKGYTMILAATQYGNIVYADDATDITKEVLTGLNAEYAPH